MKKLLFLMALLCLFAQGAWAQATLKSSTDENSREHVFKMHPRNESGNYWLTSQLGSTQSVSGAGDFIFIPAEGENNYYIYSVTEQQWLTYNNAAIANGDNKVSLSDTKGNYFKFEFGSATGSGADNSWGLKNGYLIKAINSSGTVTSQCLNWYGGPSNYNNNAKRIGFYSDGFGDAGCVWVLEENLVIGSDNSNFTEGWYQIQVSDGTYSAHEGYKGKFLKGEPNGSWGVTLTDNATDAKTYIYVTKSGDNFRFEFNKGTADHYYAAQNSYKNTSSAGDLTFYVKEENANNYKWKIWGGSNKWCGWNINNIPSIGITSGNDSQYQTCYYTFHKVNAPNTVSITYTYKIGEETVGTETFDVTIGTEFPNPSATYSTWYNYAKPENTVEETGSHDVQLTWNGPFEFANADLAEGTKWYYLKQDANLSKYVYYENNEAKTSTFSSTMTTEDKYLWAFVRKEGSTNFYMYNKQAGTMALHEQIHPSYSNHNQGTCVFADAIDGKTVNEMPLTLVQNGSTNYSIKLAAVDGTCILGNHVDGKLSIWGPSADTNNGASRFNFQEFSWSNFVQELITEANTIIEGNNGTTIGKPAKAVVDALSAAVATANAADPKTEETYNTLQSAINTYFATTNVYLPTGYYRMYNFKSDGTIFYYAYNDYAREENTNHYTLMSTTAVNTNNGIWYVVNNGNGTITIKNGEGTSLKWDNTASETLTFGGYNKGVYAKCPGGIYFNEGLHGTDQDKFSIGESPKTRRATGWAHQDSEGSYWAFEPIADAKIMNIIIKGDENGYVTYKTTQKAYNGGFFNYGTDMIKKSDYELATIDGKAAAITTFNYSNAPHTLIAEYIEKSDDAIDDLTETIQNIVDNNGKIGYPDPNDIEVATALMEIWGYTTQDPEQKEENFVTTWQNVQTLLSSSNIKLPTANNFYTLVDNAGNEKIYFLTQNNELLCYENGRFAKPEIQDGNPIVDYSEIGTATGEADTFAFMAARKDEQGMPINFGKVCAISGGDPLPSGDGNIFSGWTIRKQNALTVNVPASGITTFYAPVAMKVNEDVKVYVGSIDAEETTITYSKLEDNKIAAATAVLIKGEPSQTITISPIDEELEPQTSCLVGKEYTIACNSNPMRIDDNDKYIYTLQSGVFQYYTGSKLSGFKAHLELDRDHRDQQSGTSAFRVIFLDEQITGIDTLSSDIKSMQMYDLAGRQVNKTQRGLYIVNGKKVLR